MDKLSEAKDFLKALGLPAAQQTDICAYALLTLSHMTEESPWSAAENNWIRIHDILVFTEEEYHKSYAENTRETIRKNCLHQFRDAALVEDNGKATNSPNYRYRITGEALSLLQKYGTKEFLNELELFQEKHAALIEKYASKKKMEMMPVFINSQSLFFSPGAHNALQKSILEDFAPRFAPGSVCLYVGDTIKKDLVKDIDALSELGLEITLHDIMPDVVLYSEKNNWLYFIEAVTSVGPMSPRRILEIAEMTKNVKAGKIFVTAFPDFDTYKKFSAELAWETEVWISDFPDHMIHLNGDRFMGPRD